jgi:hypothetical protein
MASSRELSEEDRRIRKVILANGGRLVDAAAELGWPYSRLCERMRRQKQAAWWSRTKLRLSQERQRKKRRDRYRRESGESDV